MIYCVRYADVARHLERTGFRRIGSTEESEAYLRDGVLLVVRKPNVNGDIPEALVNGAFDAAGLSPPTWDVFWCD